MASEFIGYTIVVTLKSSPPVQQLQGIVADVVEQHLVLKNGIANGSFGKSTNFTKSLFCGMGSTGPCTKSNLQPFWTWRL